MREVENRTRIKEVSSHLDINDVKEHVAKIRSDLYLRTVSSKLSLMASLSYSLERSREM